MKTKAIDQFEKALKEKKTMVAVSLIEKVKKSIVRDDAGNTALHLAVKYNLPELVIRLLKEDVNIDEQNNEGDSALHLAAKLNNTKILKILLAYNANLEITNTSSKTPLEVAEDNHAEKAVSILDKAGKSSARNEQLKLRNTLLSYTSGEDAVSRIKMELEQNEKNNNVSIELKKLVLELIAKIKQPQSLLLPYELEVSKKKKRKSKYKPTIVTVKQALKNDKLAHDDPVFNELNKIIEGISTLRQKIRDIRKDIFASYNKDEVAYFESLDKLLLKLADIYNAFGATICKSDSERRLELSEEPVTLQGNSIGFRVVNKLLALRFETFLSKDPEEDHKQVRDNTYGKHSVLRIKDVFFKIRPDAPAVEFAVASLNRIITGAGTAPSELLVMKKGEVTVPVIVSKAIEGTNLQNLLTDSPDDIKYLDLYNFSAHVLMSVLTVPADGKADNYIAVIENLPNSNKRIRIVGIDNDIALTYPVMKSNPVGKKGDEDSHNLELRMIMFCFAQMDAAFSNNLRSRFTRLSPLSIMLKWLGILFVENKHYESHQKYLTQEDLKAINIPLRLPRGILIHVFKNLENAHQLLKNHTNPITHQEFLEQMSLAIGKAYQFYRNSIKDPKDAIVKVYEGESLEDVLTKNQVALTDLGQYNQTHKEVTKSMSSLASLTEEWLASLDFSHYSKIEQVLIINAICSELSSMQKIRINASKYLTDDMLSQIARNLTQIDELHLKDCAEVTSKGLCAVLNYHPKVKITLDGRIKMDAKNLLNTANFCRNFFIIMQDGYAQHIRKNNDRFLHQAIKEDRYNLISFALAYGIHLFKVDSAKNHPIHTAIEQGRIQLAEELIRYGVPADKLNKKGVSLLDLTYKAHQSSKDTAQKIEYRQLIIFLILYGAIKSTYAKEILTVVVSASKNKLTHSIRKRIFNFAVCNNTLNGENISKLCQGATTSLNLSLSDMEIYNPLYITTDLINSISASFKELKKLNLSNCHELSQQHLDILEKSNLSILYINYQQAEHLKLIDLDNLGNLNNLKIGTLKVHITSFNLVRKQLTHSQCKSLSKALSLKQCVLNTLSIVSCSLDPKHIEHLAAGLEKNTSVTTLVLNKNKFGDDGLNALLKALHHNAKLTDLSLEGNGITAYGAELLARLLPKMKTIRKLQLHGNPLTQDGAIKISELLTQCKTLEYLAVSSCQLGNIGLRSIANSLLNNQSLNRLNVGENNGTNYGISAYVDALTICTNITEFKYRGNEASSEVDNRIIQIVLHNQILKFESNIPKLDHQTTSMRLRYSFGGNSAQTKKSDTDKLLNTNEGSSEKQPTL